jgi:hypothetical protein
MSSLLLHALVATLLFFAAISCSHEGGDISDTAKELPVYSVENLASDLPLLMADSIGTFEPPGFIESYFIEPLQGGRYIAVNDRLEQMIHLFDETGAHLSSAGGEGRGPGEFMGGILLNAGQDQKLYALDMRLSRVTRFSVQQGELTYVTTYPVNLDPGSWLDNIYVTQWGNFGVVRSNLDYNTGEEVYHLYKLDDSFNQSERLLEMPGNEKMSLSEWSHVDHLAGRKTFWDLDGEWFYFVTSHSTTIDRYNLRSGEISSETYFDLADREVTPESRNQLMEFASNMMNRFPALRSTMDAVTVLPLFQELMVHDNHIYLIIFNIEGSERTELIRLDRETGSVQYADIPLKLWRIQSANGLLYGIGNSEEGDADIRILNLAEEVAAQ